MTGPYTYLVGLLIFGAFLGALGLFAAERERRAHNRAERGSRASSAPAR